MTARSRAFARIQSWRIGRDRERDNADCLNRRKSIEFGCGKEEANNRNSWMWCLTPRRVAKYSAANVGQSCRALRTIIRLTVAGSRNEIPFEFTRVAAAQFCLSFKIKGTAPVGLAGNNKLEAREREREKAKRRVPTSTACAQTIYTRE